MLKSKMILTNEEKNKHIFFLENLLSKLKNNQLSESEKRDLSEFYIKSIYEREDEKDEEKFHKYLSMGWYIYEILIRDNINNIIT